LLTLKRGYTIAKVDDNVISSSKDVKSGDNLDIKFDDGIVNTKVI
jgi:exodeoxyribonuclease VII large subunit